MALMWIVWAAAGLGAVLLYFWTPEFAGVAGVVETVDYRVAAPEPLRVVAVPVEVGTRVRKGDVLLILDPEPLALERDLMRAELDLLTAQVRFRQFTDERSFAQTVLRAEETLARERVDLARMEAELSGVRRRLAWWKPQVDAGTAPGREVAELKADEEELDRRARAHRVAVATLEAQVKEGRERMQAFQDMIMPADDSGTDGPDRGGDPAMAAIMVTQARLALLEARMDGLTLRAPADGVVQRIDTRVGDVAQAGQTTILVREDVPRRVFVYPSAGQASMMRVGMPAWVAARDMKGVQRWPAVVSAIGPGIVPFPLQLQTRMTWTQLWGQEVILSLGGPTSLTPGQVVDVVIERLTEPMLRDPAADPDTRPRVSGTVGVPDAKAGNSGAGSAGIAMEPRLISVPDGLARVTRFEPSGLTWVEELDRFIVVSDDTGLADRNEHAPWLFLMDRNGRLDERVVSIGRETELNDLESISRAPDGTFWLLASQNASKRGRRPASRTRLTRVVLADGAFVAEGRASLMDAIAALDPQAWNDLGLTARDERVRKKGFDRLLNIEGMAATSDGLLLGVKQPLDPQGRAMIWRLANPDKVIATGRVEPADLEVWIRVSLTVGEGAGAEPAGISDLAILPDGGLAILAVALPGSHGGDRGALWTIQAPLVAGEAKAMKIREFPGLKPEGIAVGPDSNELVIVFDADHGASRWIRIPVPK
jgi:multidrug efflux pump subunit AcrA (membrane-fusion protein)